MRTQAEGQGTDKPQATAEGVITTERIQAATFLTADTRRETAAPQARQDETRNRQDDMSTRERMRYNQSITAREGDNRSTT